MSYYPQGRGPDIRGLYVLALIAAFIAVMLHT